MTPEQYEQLSAKLDNIEHILTGNGTPERGVIVRLDRLEQKDASRGRWIMLIGGASLTALAKGIWASITHGGS